MDKYEKEGYIERIESMFEFKSCPKCNRNSLILNRQKYEFVKFDVINGKIVIVGDNFDVSFTHENIECLTCSWRQEFD